MHRTGSASRIFLQQVIELYPSMKFLGRWIEPPDFEAGQRVKITVEYGRLTITADYHDQCAARSIDRKYLQYPQVVKHAVSNTGLHFLDINLCREIATTTVSPQVEIHPPFVLLSSVINIE